LPPGAESVQCAYCGATLTTLRERDQAQVTSSLAEKTALAPEADLQARPTWYAPPAPAKDWLVAFLLCLFLGGWGAHRFYTGHTALGILQLLTAGGYGLWWLIDLVLLATNRYTDAKGNLLRNPNLRLGRSCVSGILAFVVLALCCGSLAVPLDRAMVEQAGLDRGVSTSGQVGPVLTGAIVLAAVSGVTVFAVLMLWGASIWTWIRRLLPSGWGERRA
jgi:TM2 domain-containing membrane protein YozV